MFAPIMINSRRHIQDKNIGRIRFKILSLNNVIILYLLSFLFQHLLLPFIILIYLPTFNFVYSISWAELSHLCYLIGYR